MILVVGSTGTLGGMIARRLLAEGRQVRILNRPNSNYQSLVQDGAQLIIGDLKDAPSLQAACQGIDTVITTANSALRGGDDNPETVERQGNINLIDAAKAAGVRQFIFVSVSGADANAPIPFVAGKGQAEDYLIASGVPYTILAPGPFAEVWIGMVVAAPMAAGLPVTLFHGGDAKTAFISIKDVAAFAICAIDHPAAINRRILLAGPQAFSFADAAGMMADIIGKELPITRVNPGDPVPTVPPAVIGLMMGSSFQPYAPSMEETESAFKIRLTTPQEMIAGILASPRKA